MPNGYSLRALGDDQTRGYVASKQKKTLLIGTNDSTKTKFSFWTLLNTPGRRRGAPDQKDIVKIMQLLVKGTQQGYIFWAFQGLINGLLGLDLLPHDQILDPRLDLGWRERKILHRLVRAHCTLNVLCLKLLPRKDRGKGEDVTGQ